MLPGSTNILDQLLGGFEVRPSGPTGTSGVSAEGLPPGLLFGDLLALVSGGAETVPDATVAGEPVELPFDEFLFPSSDQSAAQDSAPVGPTVSGSLLIDPAKFGNLKSPISLKPQMVPVEGHNLAEGMVSESAGRIGEIVESISLEAETPRFAVQPNPILNLRVTQQASLEPGAYRVLDSKVTNGQLELTLVGEAKAADPVTISVPVEVLEEALSGLDRATVETASKRPVRIPLDSPGRKQKVSIEHLLTRLNLKALEIRNEPPPVAGKSTKAPVELILIAENNGAQVALKSKLIPQDIRIFTRTNQGKKGRLVKAESTGRTIPALSETVIAEPNRLELRGQTGRQVRTPLNFDLPNGSVSSEPSNVFDPAQLSTWSLNDLEAKPVSKGSTHTPLPSVKMTLPELIQRPLPSHGRTIMIKIEPEHLGPARLHLTVRDQVMTARVIVDTPFAKMAVEGSLQQLTDQLARAGIELDRIEVTLSGGGAREQFLDRRPAWTHARRQQQRDLESNPTAQPDGLSSLTHVLSNEYVGAGGVNLLA